MVRNQSQVYIKIDQQIITHNRKIYLGDIAKLYSSNQALIKELEKICILNIKDNIDCKYMFSIMKIIEQILLNSPDTEIVNLGEKEFIIEYQVNAQRNSLAIFLKTLFVCLIVFFGAAFTIMTFNEDVSVANVFELLYELFQAEDVAKFRLIEISYSVGIAIGIIVFFNHFSQYKNQNDPTPLQVENRKYEKDTNAAILIDASRRGSIHDI